MQYTVTKSIVQIIGGIWWPMGALCATQLELTAHDLENARDLEGNLTRESVEQWVATHSGDFSSVKDFRADLHDDKTNSEVVFEWEREDSEVDFITCMFGEED